MVAEPNERKNAVETYFRPVIEKWEQTTQKIYALKHCDYESELIAYEAKRKTLEKDGSVSNLKLYIRMLLQESNI